MTDKVVILTSGTSWTTPADWNDAANTVECLAAGAAGTHTKSGGGGAYAKVSNVSLSGAVAFSIGQGGTPTSVNGGDTWFKSTTTVKAAGAIGANGGTVANSVGDIKYAGGDATANQAGGGGAAGPNGAGEDGGNPGITGGDGDAGYGGAGGSGGYGVPGGDGTEWGTVGSGGGASAAISTGGDGGNYGGGGGGAQSGTPGSGAPGCIVITYTPVSGGTTASLSGSAGMGFSTAGSLGIVVGLAGAAAMAFAAAGSLSTSGSAALSGSADMSFASAGALSTSGTAALSGSANMAFSAAGALSTGADAALSGNADLVFTAAGALAVDQPALLSGAADLAFDVAGALGGTDGLSGAASLAFSSHGILTDSVPSHLYSNFEAVYTHRQTLLNAIYAAAKGLADGAQNTANNALSQIGNLAGSQYLRNPFFTTGDLTGWSAEAGWIYQSGSNGPSTSPSYAVHNGSSANANSALRNGGQIPAYPGMVLKAQCAVNGTGSPNGSCGVRISWRDRTDAEISVTHGTRASGNGTNGTYVTGTAPANTMYAHVEADTLSHTSGSYAVDNFGAWVLPDSVDQVPDGTTYGRTKQTNLTNGDVDLAKGGIQGRILSNIGDGGGRYAVHQVDGNGLAVIDFSQSAHVNKTLDNIGDGATYARPFASRLNGGRPTINFAENIHTNKSLQYVGDGGGRYAAVHDAATQAQQAAQIAASYQPGQNIVPDPSFHWPDVYWNVTRESGWSVQHPWPATILVYHQTTTAQTSKFIGDAFPVEAGQEYYGSCTLFQSGFTSGTFNMRVQWLNASKAAIADSARCVQTGAWYTKPTYLGGTLGTAPAGAVYAHVEFFAEGASAPDGFECHISNVKVEVGSTGTPFTDYTQAGMGLATSGSGQTIGDQRNLLPVNWASVGSMLSASPLHYSISGTTVNFTTDAVTFHGGGIDIPFNASSSSKTQSAGTTQTWYHYYRDATSTGGSRSLYSTTNPQEWAAYPDVWRLGTTDVTVSTGGGGPPGGGGGGGGLCVADDMFIGAGRRAGDADIGDQFDCIDLPTAAGKHVRALQGVSRGIEDCVRLITNNGCALICSVATPFDLPDGRDTTALHMLGEQVITDLGIATVTSLALVGPRPVTRAHLGGVSYAAGAEATRRIYSHNTTVKP